MSLNCVYSHMCRIVRLWDICLRAIKSIGIIGGEIEVGSYIGHEPVENESCRIWIDNMT